MAASVALLLELVLGDDQELLRRRGPAGWLGPFARPVTDAERTLLVAVGTDPAVIEPWTHVTPVPPGVIRRHWMRGRGAQHD
ncbi:hypothetical protein [Geodermatophilus siccatus]|nr:hypothetical protein [Geodermatophilus siccatus]